MSKGESVGKGMVGSNSDNNGGVVEASGSEGTKGSTRSSGMSDFFSDDFQINKTNSGIDKVRKVTQTKENSTGSTTGETLGQGALKGQSDRFNGSTSLA